MVLRIMFSCALCFLCQTVSFSKTAYSSSPPIFLGRSLDLLMVLWGQLKRICGFTPACISFQNPQLPQSPESQANCRDLICCTCSAWLGEGDV